MSATARASLADVDLTDLDRWAKGVPHDTFALLRSEAPVFWQNERHGRGFWSLTRYDDVLGASRDHETFSSAVGGTFFILPFGNVGRLSASGKPGSC